MFPRAIILDTDQSVQALRALPANCAPEMWRHFVSNILEEVIDCHRDFRTANERFGSLLVAIDNGRYHNYINQKHLLTDAIGAVTINVVQQLRLQRIYDPDGVLRYYYYPVNDPNFNDILLIREPALAAPTPS
jgi:hypothetical protein